MHPITQPCKEEHVTEAIAYSILCSGTYNLLRTVMVDPVRYLDIDLAVTVNFCGLLTTMYPGIC